MRAIIVFASVAWFFWHLVFRRVYISYKYGKAKPIPLQKEISEEDIFELIRTKMEYPEKLHIFWNEEGNIALQCKYGEHILFIENENLYVGRNKSRNTKNIEEAEVLDTYIRKLFNTDAPVNPYKQWKKLNSHNKKYIGIHIGVVAVVVIALFVGMNDSDAYNSSNISESYLKQFSSTVTVGDAFDGFFEDGKWSKFSEGATKYVDYSGKCLFDGEKVKVIIRFLDMEDEFRIYSVSMDGVEMPEIMWNGFLEKVYEESE